jgi:hypothetical protein
VEEVEEVNEKWKVEKWKSRKVEKYNQLIRDNQLRFAASRLA